MNTLSKIQSKRHKNGNDFETHIIQTYGLQSAVRENGLVDNVGKTYHIDAFFKNMMIEITTSVKDGKEAKLRLEAKLFKQKFPNRYFVILIKKISSPRLDGYDSAYDHLISDPNIDKVLVGEEQFKKHLKKPSYKKRKINKQQGDNMNIIDQIIAKGFDIGTPDAARFLRDFVETNGDYKAPKAKASDKTKGQKAYIKGKERADKNFEEIKAKKLIRIHSSTPDPDMMPLLDKIKEFGYANTTASDHITILGGRIGQALANGVKLGCITDTPSFHKRSDLLKELYVPNDMPNPKGA